MIFHDLETFYKPTNQLIESNQQIDPSLKQWLVSVQLNSLKLDQDWCVIDVTQMPKKKAVSNSVLKWWTTE